MRLGDGSVVVEQAGEVGAGSEEGAAVVEQAGETGAKARRWISSGRASWRGRC